MGDATVWAQAESGRWERIGPDRVRGIWPEGLRATANDWGPDTCSFLVRRDPGALFPDVSPATPIDVEIEGERDWSGFVWEPPQQADERAIQVECRGWQYHLDDDLLDRFYVHSRLESWQDSRSLLTANLASYIGGEVTADGGAIVLRFPDGQDLSGGDNRLGVSLDLGLGLTAKRVVVEWESSNNSGSVEFRARGADIEDSTTGSPEDAISFLLNTGASGTSAGTFTTARRHVHLFLLYTGAATTASADIWVKVKAVRVFAATAWESGNQSILKASDVAKDLLPLAPLLDQRTDLIQATTVSLPDFVLEEQTARQGMEQANTVEGRQLRVTPERLLEYRPRPAVPLFETGSWARDALSGASRGSLEPVHNRVLVKGNDSSGGRVVVERWAAQQSSVISERVSSPSFSNPSFDVNATGWTPTLGTTITRDTGVFESGPASGLWGGGGIGSQLSTALSGTFERGVAYVIEFYSRFFGATATVRLGTATDWAEIPGILSSDPAGSFVAKRIVWVPKATAAAGVTLVFTSGASLGGIYLDSFTVGITRPTLPDRRRFVRTRAFRVERPITDLIGQGMADAALKEAMRTPFKGDATADPRVVRTFLGGAAVHPAHLLRNTGELLHHSHLVDPDSGNLGRDSRIVTVSYEDEPAVSQVGLDNTRRDFERQLARYEVTGR